MKVYIVERWYGWSENTRIVGVYSSPSLAEAVPDRDETDPRHRDYEDDVDRGTFVTEWVVDTPEIPRVGGDAAMDEPNQGAKEQSRRKRDMLVLHRNPGERILLDGGIEITLIDVRGRGARIGIKAPREIGILREEVLAKIVRAECSALGRGGDGRCCEMAGAAGAMDCGCRCHGE